MGKIIIDTDVLIDFLRGHPGAKEVLESLEAEDLPCCSVITIAEIRAGMRPSEEKKTFALLDGLESLSIDKEIALLAGKLRLQSKQSRLELDDCLIAATALHHNSMLLTHNPRYYPHPNLNLKIAKYR